MNDRIEDAKNRVFTTGGLGIGKNNPESLHTSSNYVYRVTGMSQIEDIINTGYIRPKAERVKGGHINEVFWSLGGEKLFYYDKRPVLVTSKDKVVEGQIGALSIEDLSAIMFFNEEKGKYEDGLDYVKSLYEEKKLQEMYKK